MDRKEMVDKIKENKSVIKSFHSRNETFEVEINKKRFFIAREWIEDDIGDGFVEYLIKKLK